MTRTAGRWQTRVEHQILTGGIWWHVGQYTAPSSGRAGRVVSASGTNSQRFVPSSASDERLCWMFRRGAYTG